MNPAAKRGLDLLAYTISGVALAGAAVYGVQRLTAAAPPPPTPPAAAEAAAPPAITPPPPAAVPAAAEPTVAAPLAQAATPPEPQQPAVSAQDKAAFFALQRNCYEAADNNRNGEYPALQAAACNRYSQFANEHGWDPGTLPAYGQPAPPAAAPQPAQDYAEAPAPAAEPQVIVVPQPVYYDRRFDAPPPHHGQRPPQQQPGAAPPIGITIHRPPPGNNGRRPPNQ